MTKLRTTMLAGLTLLCLTPLSALAQTMGPFETEVDCDGVFMGGDTVPYTIRAQNQTFQAQPIQVSLRARTPLGDFPLFTVNITLGPNQDLAVNRSLGLPNGAPPSNNYSLIIVGAGTDFTSFDTCSFDVI